MKLKDIGEIDTSEIMTFVDQTAMNALKLLLAIIVLLILTALIWWTVNRLKLKSSK